MTVSYDTPSPVIARLAVIEEDLEQRQNGFEDAARQKAALTRDWEKRLAIARVRATGSDAEARKAQALLTAIEVDDLYERLKYAEAEYEALKSVIKVMEVRATVGMSILRAQGRAS